MTQHQRSLYFEDLKRGYTIDTASRVVEERDITAFANLSGDFHPLHTDPDYAATTTFGERIAHGLLILSMATGLSHDLGFLENTLDAFAGLNWKYRGPVKVGDRIYAHIVVGQKRALPGYDGGLIVFNVTILNQDNITVQDGTWTLLVRSRDAAAS